MPASRGADLPDPASPRPFMFFVPVFINLPALLEFAQLLTVNIAKF
jgi:hypothetical protein